MFRVLFVTVFSLALRIASGQSPDTLKTDSIRVLDEITVQAYEYKRPIIDIPAAIGVINKLDLERFNDASLLPAINTVAGVRMEERSPGSYRLSIRGSTLRSPFGIRNVKVYWNNLPFTDPGGNTYLNLIDPGAIGQAEIIKGPGSSLYGAGTGGVFLLKSATAKLNTNETYLSGLTGSYGLFRVSAGVQNHTAKSNASVHFAHHQSDGYREQSAMRKDVLQTQGSYYIDNKRILGANFFYADLQYETPGGLTLTQYNENPKQARPAGGPNAGAVEQKAGVNNKTLYAGVFHEYDINNKWFNKTGAYLSFTQFENSAIRNFEHKMEQSFGARSTTQYKTENLDFTFGGEFQQGFSTIKTYSNNKGEIDTLQTDNEITATSALIFSQAEIILPANFFLTLGGSLSFYNIKFFDLSASPVVNGTRNFKPVLSPRIGLLKKLNKSLSIYGSFSQGFSPPTVAELYPSTALFDKNLKAERGDSYEVGFHGTLRNVFSLDIAAYIFRLRDAITIRRAIDGGEFFVNAGNTSQKGIEFNFSYSPRFEPGSFVTGIKLWTSVTLNRYRFNNYMKDAVNYSGNDVTGISPHIVNLGFDIIFRPQLYCNITSGYTDRIPLDDANTAFADSYFLLGCRVGYKPTIAKVKFEFFAGGDNLLDEQYSLGNDLNAQAGRFYNAAPARNFFLGLKTNFMRK